MELVSISGVPKELSDVYLAKKAISGEGFLTHGSLNTIRYLLEFIKQVC